MQPCAHPQEQQKLPETKELQLSISKSELQAAQDQEHLDQEHKRLSELWQGLVSELNASKKLHQSPMTVQEGQVAEEAEESNLQFSFFINRKIEIMHRYFLLTAQPS